MFRSRGEEEKTALFLRGRFSISHLEVLILPTSPNVAKSLDVLAGFVLKPF
jgi:hypothetical protein